VAGELELAVPRHLGDGAVKHRVDVVLEPGPARVFGGGKPAADALGALEAQRLQAGAAEIGLEDKPVVARPQDDAVVGAQSGGLTSVILIDLSRNSFV
jgi:hypothetical protein